MPPEKRSNVKDLTANPWINWKTILVLESTIPPSPASADFDQNMLFTPLKNWEGCGQPINMFIWKTELDINSRQS